MINEKIFIERLQQIMAYRGCTGSPTKFAALIGCNEKTIRNALKGKIPGAEILNKIATKEMPASWLIGGISNNTATITTSNHNGDIINQSIVDQPDQHRVAQPNEHQVLTLSPMEHEIILLMREYMSPARQRALLAELKEEAGKFG